MSLYNLKNESLFKSAIRESDARASVAYGIARGWIHPPQTHATIPRAPVNKKQVPIHWQDRDTTGIWPPPQIVTITPTAE